MFVEFTSKMSAKTEPLGASILPTGTKSLHKYKHKYIIYMYLYIIMVCFLNLHANNINSTVNGHACVATLTSCATTKGNKAAAGCWHI